MVASTNNDSPSVCIFGATGAQGGSVLAHLLESDKSYRIRAVTRDPTKPNAQAIGAQGVEVIKAELGIAAEVQAAVKGQDIVFAVTNFWEHGKQKELADGKRLMDAVKAANVKTIYWSGLPPVTKLSGGKYTKVEHFDSKAEVLDYAKSESIPIVDVQPAMYMENFLTMMAPRKQDDGSFTFALPVDPNSKLSLLHCARDYGAFVRGAIESKVSTGSDVLACGEEITPPRLVEQWAEVTGKKANYYPVDGKTFKDMAGEEVTEMLQWFSEFGYFGGKDCGPSKKVLPGKNSVQTWKQFVQGADWSKVTA